MWVRGLKLHYRLRQPLPAGRTPCTCAVSEESATRCARGCSTTFCRGGNIFVNRLMAIYIIFRCPAVSDFKGLTGMAWKDNMQHIRNLTEVFLPR